MNRDEIEFWFMVVGGILAMLAAISAIVYRIAYLYSKKKEKALALNQRLNDIEKRLHHLDCPQTGRVHKISDLCVDQLESNKKAYGLALYVKGKLESKANP